MILFLIGALAGIIVGWISSCMWYEDDRGELCDELRRSYQREIEARTRWLEAQREMGMMEQKP